jgi:hypothetical protein
MMMISTNIPTSPHTSLICFPLKLRKSRKVHLSRRSQLTAPPERSEAAHPLLMQNI